MPSKIVKILSLDRETEDIVEKRFKDGEFSEWVRLKLREEKDKEDSLDFMRKKVIDITREIEDRQAERAVWQKKIDLKLQEEHAKAEQILEDEEEANRDIIKIADKFFNKMGIILFSSNLQARLPREPGVVKSMLMEVAKRYARLDAKERPEITQFTLMEMDKELQALKEAPLQ